MTCGDDRHRFQMINYQSVMTKLHSSAMMLVAMWGKPLKYIRLPVAEGLHGLLTQSQRP